VSRESGVANSSRWCSVASLSRESSVASLSREAYPARIAADARPLSSEHGKHKTVEGVGFDVYEQPCVTQPRARALHLTPFTLHLTPCTQHPTPYTLHPTPYALHTTKRFRVKDVGVEVCEQPCVTPPQQGPRAHDPLLR